MKKIYHYVSKFENGGVESQLVNSIIRSTSSKYCHIIVAEKKKVSIFDDALKSYGVDTIVLNSRNKFSKAINFFRLIKTKNISHMHIHISFISTGFYAVISKIAGCKVTIVHTHTTNFSSSVFTKVLKSFVNVFLSVYKIKLIADSSESGRIFFNMKFKVMPITVNENKFRYSRSDREQVRLDLGLDKAFVMCSIGRLAEHKNHKFMLDILTELEKISPCNHLILVGDGEKKDFIIEYAVKKQVISNLSLFEPMYNIERIMAASDVFLFPSTYEGLGLVAIEAQINGLRVLASQFVPAETQITPLIDYLDISDTNAWVENILELKHRRSTSRENACINNNTKYSTEFLCNFLVDLYEEL